MYALTPAGLEAEKEEWDAALKALKATLQEKKSIYFSDSHPYFYKSATISSANAFKKWINDDTMGVAFNFNLLYHDYGSWSHNRRYTKRLIYDSIDYLANDTVGDNDVKATINALTTIDTATKDAALIYLFGSTSEADARP